MGAQSHSRSCVASGRGGPCDDERLTEVDVEQVGDDDSHPFLSAKMPVITLHSVMPDTFGILHSSKDRLEAVHRDDYYSTCRLAALYLAWLDIKTD